MFMKATCRAREEKIRIAINVRISLSKDMDIKLMKILCPVDHSECSYLALKYAISLASKDEAKLYLMHVIDSRLYDTAIYKFSPYKLNEIDESKIRTDLMKSLPEGTTDVLEV